MSSDQQRAPGQPRTEAQRAADRERSRRRRKRGKDQKRILQVVIKDQDQERFIDVLERTGFLAKRDAHSQAEVVSAIERWLAVEIRKNSGHA